MHDKSTVKILFVGDIVGIPGRALVKKHLLALKKKHAADVAIVNGENSASDGRGITPRIMEFLKTYGADIVTGGNHSFAKRDIYPYLQQHKDLLRPANFPSGAPGVGVTFVPLSHGGTLGVINLQGRVFMKEMLECPFKSADSLLTYVASKTKLIFIDFHAETTSEKLGFAYYLDGRVSAIVGTHTHVPTADERVLPGGTAFITDVGCCASTISMIGMKRDVILHNLLTQLPVKFEVETEGPYKLHAVLITLDAGSGKALSIERLVVQDDTLDLYDAELKDK